MPDNKSHHYVPQFLLRQFASDTDGRRINMMRIAERRHIAGVSIRDQCARDYYYGKDTGVEGVLNRLEGDAARVVRSIVMSGQAPTAEGLDWVGLLTFVLLQRMRTPGAIRRSDAFETAMLRATVNADPTASAELKGEVATYEHESSGGVLGAMSLVQDMLPLAADLRLKVLRSTGALEFVLGDAPVIFHNQWASGVRAVGTIGVACSGLQIAMPLAPRYTALFYDDAVYDIGRAESGVVNVGDKDVTALNALQICVAEQNVYYSADFMAQQLDRTDLTKERAEPLATATQFQQDGNRGRFIVATTNRAPAVPLLLSVASFRSAARRVPWKARGNRFRAGTHDEIRTRFPEFRERGPDALRGEHGATFTHVRGGNIDIGRSVRRR